MTFMGHVLSAKGIGPQKSKVEAVTSARNPKTASEMRSFHGLVNYCGRYIPDFSTVSAPLRELTRAKTKWIWSSRHQDAFDELKRFNAETHVIVDASPVGLGAILSQKQSDWNFRPVTFASRTLTNVEQRYSQTEREALVVVWGCDRFHLYLYGKEFILVTDHKPLEGYKPGPRNAADCLSRLSQVQDETTGRNIAEEYAYFVEQNAVPNAMTFKMIKDSAHLDKDIKQILNGKISKSNNLFRFRNELSVVGGVLLKGSRIVIPDKLRIKTNITFSTRGSSSENGVKHNRSTPYWPQANVEVERQNRTLLKAFQTANAENRDWRKEIPKFLLAYRSTPHSTTGKSPAELLFNRKIRTKLPEINAENEKDDSDTRRKNFEMKEKGKIYRDKKRKTRESDIDVGDIVLQKQTKTNIIRT
ncbi:Hypothetical predicted protein [Mytilus galloprovincialis]|uniref:Integrase catalytic domain-containing protein n=1 Tax=Mytilus galloprovincialis TaxID=29158 RepID=A0A8B6HQ70_MYTGA|nr:Hypothetical predicted protein [Mytilus galloprovincialis]